MPKGSNEISGPEALVESLLPILISERPLKITWRKEVLAPMHGGAQEFLLLMAIAL